MVVADGVDVDGSAGGGDICPDGDVGDSSQDTIDDATMAIAQSVTKACRDIAISLTRVP